MQTAEESASIPLRACPQNDRALLEDVFREQYPGIVNMLTRLTGDRAEAEDISSDIFCKLARHPKLLRGRDNAAAWVFKVASNAGLDRLRQTKRRRKREEAAISRDRNKAVDSDALEALLLEERRLRVQTVLAALRPRDAQMLMLRSSGLSYAEVAAAIEIPATSVGTLLARAEAAFERRFKAAYGDSI